MISLNELYTDDEREWLSHNHDLMRAIKERIGWLTIGEFDIKDLGNGQIYIGCNNKSASYGESGAFDLLKFEGAIAQFYRDEF